MLFSRTGTHKKDPRAQKKCQICHFNVKYDFGTPPGCALRWSKTLINSWTYLREGFTKKKSGCSFGFCPNEGRGGEGPAQIFCPLFTNCIYWVNVGMGREGETPAQICWHIGVPKKWYKLSKWGNWGNLDKIQKNSYFFREAFPKPVWFCCNLFSPQ